MANVALYTARTGLDTAQQWMSNIADTAANMKSLAYKASFLEVTDLSYTQLKRSGVQQSQDTFGRPVAVQRGSGSKVVGTTRIMTQGALKQTSNPLDIAIRGSGYFAVNLPNGVTGYTRVGALKLTKSGQVVTTEGYELADNINIDTTKYNLGDLDIAQDGTVTIKDNTQNPPATVPLGNISLWIFPNEQGLQDVGGGIAIQTDASGDPVEEVPGRNNAGSLEQNNLEMSNASSVEAMTALIEANQIWELNAKVISTASDMEKSLNNMYKS